MMLHLLSFAVAVLAVVHALPQSTLHAILQRNGPLWASAAHFEGLASSPSSSFVGAGASPTPVPESWFEGQNVDHFNGGDTRTWRQRYFARLDFWKGEGPVFVCVGGEGPPLDGTVLTASVHCNDMVELAPTVGALMFAVEHRYYGTSLPTPDFSTANMVYLSSDQAVGDLASFHDFAVEKYNISRSSKWISFGGSYPGMMASWARLKLPNVFFAAIANSAPVQAVVDFPGYNDVVADSMSAPIVGGSSECLAAIATGHAQVGNLLQSAEGQGTLATLFNLCNATALSWELNQADWAGNGVINLPVQSNDPACTQLGCNISSVCQMMLDTSKGDELHRLAYVSSVQYGGNCVNVDHNQVIASLTNTTIAGGVGRLWQYETCAQFGFYQTCVDDRCPYTKGLNTLKYNTDLCQIAFNISAPIIDARVNFTNTMTGGENPGSFRVMYVNGQIDPWHAQSILTSPGPDLPTLWVEGASHHFWTHPSLPTDSPEVIAARKAIWNQVVEWLAL